MGQVNGSCRLSTPTPGTSEIPQPIFMTLEICAVIISRTRPRTQNFRGLRRLGWSGEIVSLTHESFCPFFRFFATPTGCIFWTHPNVQYVIVRHSGQVSAFWGLERLNLKFDPLYPRPKKPIKIGTWYSGWPHKWHHVTCLQGQRVKGQGHNVTKRILLKVTITH